MDAGRVGSLLEELEGCPLDSLMWLARPLTWVTVPSNFLHPKPERDSKLSSAVRCRTLSAAAPAPQVPQPDQCTSRCQGPAPQKLCEPPLLHPQPRGPSPAPACLTSCPVDMLGDCPVSVSASGSLVSWLFLISLPGSFFSADPEM